MTRKIRWLTISFIIVSQNPVPTKIETNELQPQIQPQNPLDHYLSDAALKALEEGVAANTRRAYREDLTAFITWCEQVGRTPLPATPETLTEYATHLINTPTKRGQLPSPASVERARSAIRQAHRAQGLNPPDSVGFAKVVKGYAERLATSKHPKARKRKASAASRATLEAMIAPLDLATPAGLRDKAILLTGFVAAARRSELALLNIEDVTDHDDGVDAEEEGLSIELYRKKTRRWQDVPIAYGSDPGLCPVVALREWIECLALHGRTTGPLFVRIDRHGNIGPAMTREGQPIGDPDGRLTGQSIGDIVTKLARAVGLKGRWTGHSVRRGYATSARRAGATREVIESGGDWKAGSPTVAGYIEQVDAREGNPMKRVL